MSNPIVFFEILGKDKAVLDEFYTGVFGWQFSPGAKPDTYSMISPGTGINGGIGKSMDGGPGHVTFYVEVENVAESISAVESRGGQRVSGPDQLPDGPLIALVTDPEGHIIGLVEAGSYRKG